MAGLLIECRDCGRAYEVNRGRVYDGSWLKEPRPHCAADEFGDRDDEEGDDEDDDEDDRWRADRRGDPGP
jgi:hypothetical protein